MKLYHLAASLYFSLALSCSPPPPDSNNTLPFTYIPGNDGPADPATKSYFVNHIGMLTSDLNRTRDWYKEVLGMREVFTMVLSPEYTVMYMGHSQGGRNGSGFQTGEEMGRDKNNMAGLIEFQMNTGSKDRMYKPTEQTTFSHFGLIVDDIVAAQARFDALGVRIIKRYEELDITGDTEESRTVGEAWGFYNVQTPKGQEDIKRFQPGLVGTGFMKFLVVADPDGNLFEVQALVPTGV